MMFKGVSICKDLRRGNGKLWPVHQIYSATFVNKVLFKHSHTFLLIAYGCFQTATFKLGISVFRPILSFALQSQIDSNDSKSRQIFHIHYILPPV